jgi:Ni/Co efflux regulator RcnB
MKNLLFAGVAGLSMLVAVPASAASDSFAPALEKGGSSDLGGVFEGRKGGGHGPVVHRPGVHRPHHGPGMGSQHRWGHRMGGRWFVGFYAPGGWGGYRAPYRGYVLPTYWVNPSYRINNYPLYGLSQPQTGYGWTRYYDDAVLTDGRGYVQDYRRDIPWDRYEGGYAPGDYPEPQYGPAMGADRGVYYGDDRVYADSDYPGPVTQAPIEYRPGTGDQGYGAPYANDGYYPQQQAPMPAPAYQSRYGFEQYEQCLRNRGVAGGVIGSVVGAVSGNRVAGRGNRTIGTVLGGVFGGVAGVSIEKATKKCSKYLPREDHYYYGQSGYPQQGSAYPPPPPQYYPPQPYPQPQPQPQPYPQQGGGYYHQGWYYPAPVVTTVTITPAVTTTTTVTEEVYYETVAVPHKKRPLKKWKPKPKPKCVCR